jgi:hypothetical protein
VGAGVAIARGTDEAKGIGVAIACEVVDDDGEIGTDGAAAPRHPMRTTPRIATATVMRIG